MQAPAAARRAAAADLAITPSQVARTLMVLGLLNAGPKHGYELHRVVVAHGSLYADFKKPTLYHLLHRLELQGAVQAHSEGGARGPRGERLVFALTRKGEALLARLLRSALRSYEASQTGFEVAAAFLPLVPAAEAQGLLRQRREVVRARRAEVVAEQSLLSHGEMANSRVAARLLASDHALSLMDAEIAWMDRAIRQLAGGARRAGANARGVRRALG